MTERETGAGRRTREEIEKWNQMMALEFQTRGRHQTSTASFGAMMKHKQPKFASERFHTSENLYDVAIFENCNHQGDLDLENSNIILLHHTLAPVNGFIIQSLVAKCVAAQSIPSGQDGRGNPNILHSHPIPPKTKQKQTKTLFWDQGKWERRRWRWRLKRNN